MEQELKKFASDAAYVIQASQRIIASQAKEIAELKKLNKCASERASAPQLNEELLQKAANAMYVRVGSPESASPEMIADYWRSNPDSLLTALTKVANENTEAISVNGADVGKIRKSASAGAELDADEAFWSEYGN